MTILGSCGVRVQLLLAGALVVRSYHGNLSSRVSKYKEKVMSSLYEELGGAAAVDAAVESFYRKVLDDERVERFFKGIDMPRQIAKQKAFLTMAFGGPNKYSGRSMRAAHLVSVASGLNDTHFDAVVELLGETLGELGVRKELIQQVAAIAESVRDDVLNRQATTAS